MKDPKEMATDKFRLFPRSPHVVQKTPYFDINEFEKVSTPDGVPAKVWNAALPGLKTLIDKAVAKWSPMFRGEDELVTVSPKNLKVYQAAMQRGVLSVLSARISDKARSAAYEKEAELTGKRKLTKPLAKQAIDTGKEAIINNFRKLLNDDILGEVFGGTYRRICLGEVKYLAGHKIRRAISNHGWTVEKGNAKLENRHFAQNNYSVAEINYSGGSPIFSYSVEDADSAKIGRLYIGYRGDASWARVYFKVTRNGKVYRTNEIINLYNSDWNEAELRWAGSDSSRIQGKNYFVLNDTGERVHSNDLFEIELKIVKSDLLTAWYDKALRNYRKVFREVPFARYIMTSLSLCIINIVLAVFSCSLVAYAFARLEWPGRDIFFMLMLSTMMIPTQVVMLPGFLIWKYLGFYNTLVPLWLYSAFGNAFFIFLLRQFMLTLPKSLEEAARMDGCGFFGIYWHVILPLIKPTIATIAIYTFTGCWNNFMGPLIYVNDEALFPLALGLFKFNLISGADTGLMMAGSFLMTLPIIILFFFAQKYFVQGITLSGCKE
jgi:multiple sugar transport system permease protein